MVARALGRQAPDMGAALDDHCHLLRCFLHLRRHPDRIPALILEMALMRILSVVAAEPSTMALAAAYDLS